MFGNMSWIITKTESKNAESVERLSVCSPVIDGVFFFGVNMDTIEAKKNLEIYKRNLSRLENYNHLFSSHTFKTECQREVNTLRTRIENLENAFDKEAKRNKSTTMH